MANRFGGIPVDAEPASTGGRFGGIPVEAETPPAAREPAPMPEFMGEFAVAAPYKGSPESQIPASVREFERKEGPFGYAKEFAKGTAAAVAGLPAEMTVNLPSSIESLGRLGLRTLGADVSPKTAIPRVGYGAPEASEFFFGKPTSEIAGGIRTAGEVLGGLATPGLGVSSVLGRGARVGGRVQPLEELRAAANAKFGAGTQAAEQEFARLIEQAERQKDIAYQATLEKGRETQRQKKSVEARYEQESRAPAAVTPEKSAEEVAALSVAELPKPTTGADIAAGKYPERNLRAQAEPRYEAAVKEQEVGKTAFETYEAQANAMERGAIPGVKASPFMAGPEAQQVVKQLATIARGGVGPLTEYSKNMRDLASSVIKQLSGGEAGPANFKTVDTLIRDLRDKAQNKKWEGYSAEQANNFVSVADKLEEALKNWVGAEFYPRDIYAASSVAKNKWVSRLGDALRGTEEIPYTGKPGMFTTPESKLADIVYESRDSVRFAKDILGSKAVEENALQVAVNKLQGKTSKDVEKWLNSTENAWIDEIGGLRNKLGKYQSSLAEQEGRTVASKALQEQAETRKAAGLKEVEKTLKGYADDWQEFTKALDAEVKQAGGDLSNIKKQLNSVGELFRIGTIDKIVEKWPPVRTELESTGLFTAAELDQLGNMVAQTAKSEKIRENLAKVKDYAAYIASTKIAKAIGVGTLGFGAYGFKRFIGD
jgi:hypothetical protein